MLDFYSAGDRRFRSLVPPQKCFWTAEFTYPANAVGSDKASHVLCSLNA